jgi:putative two-component system hydrogenase maturation factor HypX/HoxX
MGAAEACRLGLADRRFVLPRQHFHDAVLAEAACLAEGTGFLDALDTKAYRRTRDEIAKPLADYRREELDRMRINFYGFDPSYHVARYNFVRKIPKSRTPVTLARHRSGNAAERRRAS